MKKLFGFTLAEVLITLGVIGVVAALSLPGLITNYQKKVTAGQLQESYSILQNAIRLSQYENGNMKRWNYELDGSAFFHRYIAPYIKYGDEKSAYDIPRTLLNGGAYHGTTFSHYHDFAGASYTFHLLNGSQVTFNLNSTGEKGLWIGIDVNGENPPNRIGRDSFLFFLSQKYGLQPLGAPGTPRTWLYGEYRRENIVKNSSNRCHRKQSGYWCAALIMNDGWKIKADYPW